MSENMEDEKIIKSKSRVKQHGEVFTPRHIVNNMINLPGLKDTIRKFETTVLEPACGEGIFLVEILKKRLKKVREKCEKDLTIYENLALLSLTTLYGIELLEDNAQKCVINIYETFKEDYSNYVFEHNKKKKKKVLNSAKTIIAANIVEGNFLTKMTNTNTPIVFSEWRIAKKVKPTKYLKVERTEFKLEEIMRKEPNDSGNIYEKMQKEEPVQLTLLPLFDNQDIIPDYEEEIEKEYRYKTVKLIDVYKKEMEEVRDGSGEF